MDVAEQAKFDQQQIALCIGLFRGLSEGLIDGGEGGGGVTRRHPDQMAKITQGLGIVRAKRKGRFKGLFGAVKLAKALEAPAKDEERFRGPAT